MLGAAEGSLPNAEEAIRVGAPTAPAETTTGFMMADGRRRKYDAPEPPLSADWSLIRGRLREWSEAATKNIVPPPFDPDRSNDLFGEKGPDDDMYSVDDTRHSVRETTEVVRPFAVSVGADGKPARWRLGAERELRGRGVRLADSFVITLDDDQSTAYYGVRAFHVGFRYFLFVVLGGEYDGSGVFADPEGMPVVGYYFAAITQKEAELNKCV